jgi:hypothetical protein
MLLPSWKVMPSCTPISGTTASSCSHTLRRLISGQQRNHLSWKAFGSGDRNEARTRQTSLATWIILAAEPDRQVISFSRELLPREARRHRTAPLQVFVAGDDEAAKQTV